MNKNKRNIERAGCLSTYLVTYYNDEYEEEVAEKEAYSYEQACFLAELEYDREKIISVDLSVIRTHATG